MEYFLSKIADAVNGEGGSSGSGGGANVLTLYISYDEDEGVYIAYKDGSRTQAYETYDEAANAVANADIIKVISDNNHTIYFGSVVICNNNALGEQVIVKFGESFDDAYLFSVNPVEIPGGPGIGPGTAN